MRKSKQVPGMLWAPGLLFAKQTEKPVAKVPRLSLFLSPRAPQEVSGLSGASGQGPGVPEAGRSQVNRGPCLAGRLRTQPSAGSPSRTPFYAY